MSNRRPTKPWLAMERGDHANLSPFRTRKRRTLKGNKRLRFVIEGAVRNGLAACPYCGIVKHGHEITHPVHWKSNDDERVAGLNS